MHADPRTLFRALARAAAPAVLTGLALAVPAPGAAAHAASAVPDPIRYAAVRTCKGDKGFGVPCGAWRLTLRSGRTVTLSDARVTPRDGKGKVLKNQVAAFAVSGDGGTVAYFRKRDDRLVVRRLGGEPRVVGYTPPKDAGMHLTVLYLSPDGSRLAVEAGDGPRRRPTLVYDLLTGGGPGQLPGTLDFHGFSGDGAAALATRSAGDDTTRLVTFPGEQTELDAFNVAPPRDLADNPPYALAADGRRVAFLSGSGERVRLRWYDLESGRTARGPEVGLRGEEQVEALAWTGENLVTAHVSRPLEGRRTAVRVLEIDTVTGRTAVRDSYTVGAKVFGYAVRGA